MSATNNLIYTAAQLANLQSINIPESMMGSNLAVTVNASTSLHADIDLNSKPWMGMVLGSGFTFDGQSHTVKNVLIRQFALDEQSIYTPNAAVGLFASTKMDSEIKNITIDGFSVEGSAASAKWVGSLVGYSYGTKAYVNCQAKNVNIISESADVYRSKQKRKNPLTTIAISQEYAQKLDEYIKGVALTRKDFVELAIDYFLRTGFDIRSEAFDLSPLERITDRLESSAKVMEQHNEGTEAVRQLLQAVREQTAKQLPAPELIAKSGEEKAKAELRAEEQRKEIARLRAENSALLEYKEKAFRELCRIRNEQKFIGKM